MSVAWSRSMVSFSLMRGYPPGPRPAPGRGACLGSVSEDRAARRDRTDSHPGREVAADLAVRHTASPRDRRVVGDNGSSVWSAMSVRRHVAARRGTHFRRGPTEMADRMFGGLVKAVVDVERGLMAVDAEMHADEGAFLLGDGSRQQDLWAIDLYPGEFGSGDFLEFAVGRGPAGPGADPGTRGPSGDGTTSHPGLAAGRWWTLTLAEQLANAGADVGRAIRARDAGNETRFDGALQRALELLDLTLADPMWAGPRLREIARAARSFSTSSWVTMSTVLRPTRSTSTSSPTRWRRGGTVSGSPTGRGGRVSHDHAILGPHAHVNAGP